ncbi:MAG: hypothetical protein HKN76_04935 [Saprospiraceae bacterium]|nr:hypothetical protein [Saprospiraceae bacterium]
MSTTTKFYQVLKKIHLYAGLSTAALLIMYVATSYMMIHHDSFPSEGGTQSTENIKITAADISEDNWVDFIRVHDIKGRLNNERINASGEKIMQFNSAATNTTLKINATGDEVEITRNEKNLAHSIIGVHRLSGYDGPLKYNLYALFLDAVGISLILFTITGVIMWLRLLKNNKWAWGIFIAGAIYYGIVMVLLYIG